MVTKQRFYCSGGSTVWCLASGSSVQSNSLVVCGGQGFRKGRKLKSGRGGEVRFGGCSSDDQFGSVLGG